MTEDTKGAMTAGHADEGATCESDVDAGIVAASALLEGAKRVVVLTGAGVSAESGVPTFRGEEGLWRRHDPMQLATPEAFARDPRGVWAWYRWRRSVVARCVPNAAHDALVALERRTSSFLLVTQNVDGLHARAGSRHLATLHGDLFETRCTACGWRTNEADGWPHEAGVDVSDPESDPDPPHCPACGALARPGVVWFGEMLPETPLHRALDATSRADVMLVVGTSAVVYPAASLVPRARRAGASVVVIDPSATDPSGEATVHLRARAAEVLPRVVGALGGASQG